MIKKGYTKNNSKGITLIALVITIIILLILAGVTISMVLNGGIIDKAQTATEQYTKEQAKERVQELLADYSAEKYTNNVSLEDYLNKLKTEEKIDDVVKNEDSTYTITLGGYDIVINEENKIVDVSTSEEEESIDTVGLVEYWSLNDSLGNTETTTSTGNLVVNKGNVQFEDGAVYLSNTVLSTQGNYVMPETFTIKLDYKPIEAKSRAVIFGKQNGYASNSNIWGIQIRNSADEFVFCNGKTEYTLSYKEVFNLNEWNEIKITYDGTNLKLYVNNTEMATLSGFNDITSKIYLGGGIYPGTSAGGVNWNYANGYFKNLAIYDVVK